MQGRLLVIATGIVVVGLELETIDSCQCVHFLLDRISPSRVVIGLVELESLTNSPWNLNTVLESRFRVIDPLFLFLVGVHCCPSSCLDHRVVNNRHVVQTDDPTCCSVTVVQYLLGPLDVSIAPLLPSHVLVNNVPRCHQRVISFHVAETLHCGFLSRPFYSQHQLTVTPRMCGDTSGRIGQTNRLLSIDAQLVVDLVNLADLVVRIGRIEIDAQIVRVITIHTIAHSIWLGVLPFLSTRFRCCCRSVGCATGGPPSNRRRWRRLIKRDHLRRVVTHSHNGAVLCRRYRLLGWCRTFPARSNTFLFKDQTVIVQYGLRRSIGMITRTNNVPNQFSSLLPGPIRLCPDSVSKRIAMMPSYSNEPSWKEIRFWILGSWLEVPHRLPETKSE